MLASTPNVFIAMKHISTASGNNALIRIELRRCITITRMTMMVTRISSTERLIQRAERLVDQPRAVVERNDRHLAGRDPRRPLVARRRAQPRQLFTPRGSRELGGSTPA